MTSPSQDITLAESLMNDKDVGELTDEITQEFYLKN